jgi:DNA (cytosine-5)-methyltransferase 1
MGADDVIPVIDLFAGPGGLGEGFSAPPEEGAVPRFKIRLSIEKDATAHQTLELRALYRQFGGEPPADGRGMRRGVR